MINKINLFKLSDGKSSFVYKVELGDNVKNIAEKYQTTPMVIIRINNLKREVEVGEFILIEKLFGIEYVVKPKDTIESIAKKFGCSAITLMTNNMTDFIFVGQKIYV